MDNIYNVSKLNEEISTGRLLIIFETHVYDLTNWHKRHPGGELVIKHAVGKDATDPILVNHSHDIAKKMKPFLVGKFIDKNNSFVDKPLSIAFRKLHDVIKAENYYKTNPWFYVVQYARFISLFLLSLALLYYTKDTFIGCMVAGLLMGAFWRKPFSLLFLPLF